MSTRLWFNYYVAIHYWNDLSVITPFFWCNFVPQVHIFQQVHVVNTEIRKSFQHRPTILTLDNILSKIITQINIKQFVVLLKLAGVLVADDWTFIDEKCNDRDEMKRNLMLKESAFQLKLLFIAAELPRSGLTTCLLPWNVNQREKRETRCLTYHTSHVRHLIAYWTLCFDDSHAQSSVSVAYTASCL